MKRINTKLAVIALVPIGLLFTIGLSKPGRSAINRLISLVAPSPVTTTAEKNAQPLGNTVSPTATAEDVEGRARVRHGWNATVINAVARGTITYYDSDGMVSGQAAITLYRKYPQLLRIEIDRGGTVEVLGFDQVRAWKAGAATLSEEDARDIRAFLRMGPERLFVTRGGGSPYREAGRRVEDSVPGADGTVSPVMLEQVRMEDTIGPPPIANRVGDRRSVYYYIERDSSTVVTARWLEPDDPRRSVSDPNTPLTDVRVDFTGWQRVAGVLWPFEISHELGGRVDYRIQLSQVKLNQPLADTLFNP